MLLSIFWFWNISKIQCFQKPKFLFAIMYTFHNSYFHTFYNFYIFIFLYICIYTFYIFIYLYIKNYIFCMFWFFFVSWSLHQHQWRCEWEKNQAPESNTPRAPSGPERIYIGFKSSLGFPVWDPYAAGPLPDSARILLGKSYIGDKVSHLRSR